jgi:quercetin dioxygenase-like cupin family protein
MNRLMIPAILVATGLAAVAWSAPAPQAENHRYFMMPLEKDPTREVGLQTVSMPPGAGNEFHRHPGEQWTAIQEGEITFTIKGKPPQVLKAGEYNYVPRGTVHRQQNLSGRPARYIEMRIFDKGVPASVPEN